MIKIRRVEPERVREISRQVLWTEDGESVWTENSAYWAAFDGDKIVGYGGYTLSRYWADCVYFNDAGVLREYRGKGLQKRLIRARLRAAKKAGFWAAYTYTAPSNPASSQNLIRCGFRPYWPKNPYAGEGWCYWWRKL